MVYDAIPVDLQVSKDGGDYLPSGEPSARLPAYNKKSDDVIEGPELVLKKTPYSSIVICGGATSMEAQPVKFCGAVRAGHAARLVAQLCGHQDDRKEHYSWQYGRP
uniref:SFRICE_029698 n=1 Tax=Spodoptera frugiperda TaxID=7108 RepID=A0A2H1V2P9_SPOFR